MISLVIKCARVLVWYRIRVTGHSGIRYEVSGLLIRQGEGLLMIARYSEAAAAVTMTRLRIKTSDGKLERITLPNNSTLRDLKELILRDVLRDTGTTPVKLSLNNKVPGPCPGSGIYTLLAAFLSLLGSGGAGRHTRRHTASSWRLQW